MVPPGAPQPVAGERAPGGPGVEPPPRRGIGLSALLGLTACLIGFIVFFGPRVVAGRDLFFSHETWSSDLWHLNYPFKSFYARELAAGRLPLWCPELGTGFPLLAEGQVGALYPPNLLLFRVLSLPLAFNLSILLHALLAGAATAALVRRLGGSVAGAVLSALVFVFSGFFVGHVKHVNMTAVGAFLPVLLLAVLREASRPAAMNRVAAALAVAAMGLLGHPQTLYNNLLVAAAFTLVLAIDRARAIMGLTPGLPSSASSELVPRKTRRGLAAAFGLLARTGLWVGLGLLLAAPQLLPTLELNRLGPRAHGLSAEQALGYSLKPPELRLFVAPFSYGNPGKLVISPVLEPRTGAVRRDPSGRPLEQLTGYRPPWPERTSVNHWEALGYVGLLPLGLAAIAPWTGRCRGAARGFLLLLAATLLLALGPYGGLARLFHAVLPGFDLFRFPNRFLLQADFALAVLAGLGLTSLLERLARRPPRYRRAAAALLPLACFTDLYLNLHDYNPRIDRERWTAPPQSVRRMREGQSVDAGPYRMLDLDFDYQPFRSAYRRARGWKGTLEPYDVAKEMLNPNLNLLYGVTNLHTYLQVFPDRMWQTYLALVVFDRDPGGRVSVVGVDHRMAAMLNARYLLAPFAGLEGPFEPLARLTGEPAKLPETAAPAAAVYLYGHPGAAQRAYLVPAARTVDADGAAPGTAPVAMVQRLLDPSFDPRRQVLIERRAGVPAVLADPPGDALLEPVKVVSYGPQDVVLEAQAKGDCWLFLSDTPYPGWRAYLDGAEVPFHAANLAGRAVRFPAGRHRVRFRFVPASLRLGFALAAAAALGVLALGARPGAPAFPRPG